MGPTSGVNGRARDSDPYHDSHVWGQARLSLVDHNASPVRKILGFIGSWNMERGHEPSPPAGLGRALAERRSSVVRQFLGEPGRPARDRH
jgi:hypothetical protein